MIGLPAGLSQWPRAVAADAGQQNPRLLTPAGMFRSAACRLACGAWPAERRHLLGRTQYAPISCTAIDLLLEPGDAVTFTAVDAEPSPNRIAPRHGEIIAELMAS